MLEGPWSWDARSSHLALLAGVEEQGCGEGCQGGEAGRVGRCLRHFPFAPKNRELQIMRKLDHCNIVRLRYFFYSSGEKVRPCPCGGVFHLDSTRVPACLSRDCQSVPRYPPHAPPPPPLFPHSASHLSFALCRKTSFI